MKFGRVMLVAGVAVTLCFFAGQPGILFAAQSAAPADPKLRAENEVAGLHDFDFLFGRWRVHHRQRKGRLTGTDEWREFDGTVIAQPLMGGYANVDDNVLDTPAGTYRAASLRSFDPKTHEWSIWWLDGRSPGAPLDPPVRGKFENSVGTFYAEDTFNGKPIRVRFVWSQISHTAGHWEQAYSIDKGITWETNWVMDFKRVE